MPTYEYQCDKCNIRWDVIKSISMLENAEFCSTCNIASKRCISAPALDRTSASGWNNQQFNPALGCYTRNDQHAKKIAKSRGLEEIGNEHPDKMHDYFEKKREEIKQDRWAEVDREKVYD